MDNILCTYCAGTFKPTRKENVFCSRECYKSHLRRTEERVCAKEDCDNSFIVIPANPKKFCSGSCRATVTNTGRKRAGAKPQKFCPYCSIKISQVSEQCSECFHVNRRDSRIRRWTSGEWDGCTPKGDLSVTIRSHLMAEAGYRCTKCQIELYHPIDGNTLLQINHIDGNWTNQNPNNLEVLCPNCHAQTSNYGSRNMGNGRTYRRRKVEEAEGSNLSRSTYQVTDIN